MTTAPISAEQFLQEAAIGKTAANDSFVPHCGHRYAKRDQTVLVTAA
ncbi:MAG: hypothetical protein ABJP90_02550 [Paracoccaceae bacterium]